MGENNKKKTITRSFREEAHVQSFTCSSLHRCGSVGLWVCLKNCAGSVRFRSNERERYVF